jgi:hypothetical protein
MNEKEISYEFTDYLPKLDTGRRAGVLCMGEAAATGAY